MLLAIIVNDDLRANEISKIHLLRSRGTDVFTWNRMDALQCEQIAICQNFKRQIQYIWCTNFYKFHQYYLATWMQFTIREKSNILSHLQGSMHPKSHGLILSGKHPVKPWHFFLYYHIFRCTNLVLKTNIRFFRCVTQHL